MTDFSFEAGQIVNAVQEASWEISAQLTRPCVLFKPTLKRDVSVSVREHQFEHPFIPPKEIVQGWVATLGDLQGRGSSPDEAMKDFDERWNRSIEAPAEG